MQRGSLVVVLPIPHEYKTKHNWYAYNVMWVPKDDGIQPHVIRYIGPADDCKGEVAVAFEEGIIATSGNGHEIGLSIEYVREIQGPNEVEAQKWVEESILVTV